MAMCVDAKLTSFCVCLRVMIKVLNPARVKRTGPAEDSVNLPKTKSSSLLSMHDFKLRCNQFKSYENMTFTFYY